MPPKPKSQASSRTLTSNAQKLYNACAAHPTKTEFTSEDLQATNIAASPEALLALCEELHDAMLFVYIQADSAGTTRLTYRTRKASIAAQLAPLSETEQAVYRQIEAAGTAGMWTKHLRLNTQVHQSALTGALKKLEGRGLVKQTKNVSFPGRKLYMLAGLDPTNEATGGPWYQDGEPDYGLVDTVKNLAVMHIRQQSWRHGPRRLPPPERKVKGPAVPVAMDENDPNAPKLRLSAMELDMGPPALDDKGHMLLPYPPGHDDYPTASSILAWINRNGIISGKDIKVEDVEQLLTVLMYEARIEPMGTKRVPYTDSDDDSDEEMPDADGPTPGEMMYRSTRQPWGQADPGNPGNAFADTPCARCPVFRLCEDGGPVDARSCGYFDQWLGN